VGRTESIIIKTDKEVLDKMGDWCKDHHGKSGLTKACIESQVNFSNLAKFWHFFDHCQHSGLGNISSEDFYGLSMFIRTRMC
jgi:oligoribonuclease (3'-5' exoribonuclease)